ncbi:MAG: HEAT repeat domain-containing protein [Gemmataceae bacterium]
MIRGVVVFGLGLGLLCFTQPITTLAQNKSSGTNEQKQRNQEDRATARGTVLSPSEVQIQADSATLDEVGIGTQGKALLAYFGEIGNTKLNPKAIQQLIKELGSESFKVREDAYANLKKMGIAVVRFLRETKKGLDPEAQARVAYLLESLEKKANPAVQEAAVRMLGVRQPIGAGKVLLTYLSLTKEPAIVDAIRTSLGGIAKTNDNVTTLLTNALSDSLATRRRVAATALLKGNRRETLPQIRKLLQDQNYKVRVAVALEMIKVPENSARKAAIKAMISAMAKLPPEQLWDAEIVLVRLAGEKAPVVSLGEDKEDKKKCADAWSKWWTEALANNIQLQDIDKISEAYSSPLVVLAEPGQLINNRFRRFRRIVEFDSQHNKKWEFTLDDENPTDAQIVSINKILVAEFRRGGSTGRITERDQAGKLNWSKDLPDAPISIQRLRNGNTFVATPSQLLELDRARKTVYTHRWNSGTIFRAVKLRNGNIALVTNSAQLFVINPRANNQAIATFRVGNYGSIGNYFGNMTALPNGNLLIPLYRTGEVAEFTPQGEKKWSVRVPWPSTVARLPNGNTLIGSVNTRKLVEVNALGQTVWSKRFSGQIFQVRVR